MRLRYIIGLLFLLACGESYKESKILPLETIVFDNLEKQPISSLFSKQNTKYILLESIEFRRIDKIKSLNERIYILDSHMASLTVYDTSGHLLAKVGTRGQGPQEYVHLTDFDVDSRGRVFVLDGRQNKLLCYNDSYECTEVSRLPFQADIVAALDNDSLLFGLSSWNEGEGKGRKVAKTDRHGAVGKTFLDYDEYTDAGYWISSYLFAEAESGLAYNQTIDNAIYLFSPEGELQSSVQLDFGSENVPDKDKVDIETKLKNYDHYSLIRKVMAVTDAHIIGFLWQHRQKKLFVIDRLLGTCYLSDAVADTDRRLGCGYSRGAVFSYLDEESEELPDSVNAFIRDEGMVLAVQPVPCSGTSISVSGR
ncbi:MAG: 6-bladed beta-propeller [Phocaeicola plebeius]